MSTCPLQRQGHFAHRVALINDIFYYRRSNRPVKWRVKHVISLICDSLVFRVKAPPTAGDACVLNANYALLSLKAAIIAVDRAPMRDHSSVRPCFLSGHYPSAVLKASDQVTTDLSKPGCRGCEAFQ